MSAGEGEGNSVYDADANEGKGNYTLIEKAYTRARAGGWPDGGGGGNGSSNAGHTEIYDFVKDTTFSSGTGGGGGTDVILGTLTSDFVYADDNDKRIIVAGGGGGNTQRPGNPWPILIGGAAGNPGVRNDGYSNEQNSVANHTNSSTDEGVTGRSSTYGGTGGSGKGEGIGGGGGGYRGGGAFAEGTTKTYMASGAGGTNYVDESKAVVGSIQKTTAETIGNGWAKITWIGASQ